MIPGPVIIYNSRVEFYAFVSTVSLYNKPMQKSDCKLVQSRGGNGLAKSYLKVWSLSSMLSNYNLLTRDVL